jgi:cell division septum initiation protein DivIVA
MDAAKLVDDLTGRVRAALDEAEEKAREIVADAEDKAKELIAGAEADAAKIRERAESEAHDRLAQVREALASLEGSFGASPSSEIDPGPAEVPEPMPPVEPEPSPPVEPEPQPPAEPEPMPPDPEIEPRARAEPDRDAPQLAQVAVATNGFSRDRSHDATAARIVAMKMALDGSTRGEIESHLDENYEIEASDKLLDDVMTRAKR